MNRALFAYRCINVCGSGCGCVHMYTFISRYFLVENENENGESRIDCMMAWKIDDDDGG